MERKLNQEHYALVIKCSNNNNFTEWNDFVHNFDDIIRLCDADLSGLDLSGANFTPKNGKKIDLYRADFSNSKLQGVMFNSAHMVEAKFTGAKVSYSSFQDADLKSANLEGAEFHHVDFSCADLSDTNLRRAIFFSTQLYETNFSRAMLEDAHFFGFGHNPLIGIEIRQNLCGSIFRGARFNAGTYFDISDVSINTDFRTITFESANYSPGLRQTLRYCNRRHNWRDWRKKKSRIMSFIAAGFWYHSDYGQSVARVIKSFSVVSLFFAALYFIFPHLIHGLEPYQPARSLYFSIVTMTTLGYGDMYPNPESWIAQCLVIIQVLYGYIILGSLITVLSNLFSSDGPAQGLIKHPKKQKISIAVTMKSLPE